MKILKITFLFLALAVSVLYTYGQDNASNTSIDKITNAYLGVKNALIINSGATAQNKAKELLASITGFPVDGLTAVQRKTWVAYQDKLQFDSRHISETTDTDHQKEHFASLSSNLYQVLKAFKMNSSTLYQQYCPMKKAYWLSESPVIKNPYFGKQMPECGRTTETLAPATK